jgi:hypothetical protein
LSTLIWKQSRNFKIQMTQWWNTIGIWYESENLPPKSRKKKEKNSFWYLLTNFTSTHLQIYTLNVIKPMRTFLMNAVLDLQKLLLLSVINFCFRCNWFKQSFSTKIRIWSLYENLQKIKLEEISICFKNSFSISSLVSFHKYCTYIQYIVF